MGDIPEVPSWENEEEFSLAFPWLVVTSAGGPFEDTAYSAGYQCGEIAGELSSRRIAAGTRIVYSAVVEQLDLIAMHYGYTCDVLQQDDNWATVGFTRMEEWTEL